MLMNKSYSKVIKQGGLQSYQNSTEKRKFDKTKYKNIEKLKYDIVDVFEHVPQAILLIFKGWFWKDY